VCVFLLQLKGDTYPARSDSEKRGMDWPVDLSDV
jgi:hypothetical protein